MIKTLAITLGILAMASPADAHGKGKGKGGGGRGEPTAEQKAARAALVAKYDKNADGELDEAERAAVPEEDRAKLGGHHGRGHGRGRGEGAGKAGGPGNPGGPGKGGGPGKAGGPGKGK